MYQLYDREFKTGFLFSTLCFLIQNIKSYFDVIEKYRELIMRGEPRFSGGDYFPWGYPFEYSDGLMHPLNILTIILCSFFVGLVFRFISHKISKKN